ncbi:SRPBCC domain-containing protein [Pedobacter gandavensis]|uniref:SRPBCC family protein n=1 Tax=Pedobacter gandavensis TaxID=2679963 RepID=UPI0029307A91|nr:SRPBCC domain-containing protein [Pedobacter gandavensis]
MENQNFIATILVDQSSEEVFSAIKNVRAWWSENIEGGTEQLNDEFTYHYQDVHITKFKITELIPNKKLVWHVMENTFKFTKDKHEWTDNLMIFEISEKDNRTELQFTQLGLIPEYECYDICSNAWNHYIKDSLQSLITTGKGQPTLKEEPNELEESFVEKWDAKSSQ